MKALLLCIMVGLLIKCAFSTVIVYWFPLPQEARTAWNTPKERMMERAGTGQELAFQ